MTQKVIFEVPSDQVERFIKIIETIINDRIEVKQDQIHESTNLQGIVKYIKERGIKISESTVYKKAATGAIPCSKVGGSLIFHYGKINEWIEARTFVKTAK